MKKYALLSAGITAFISITFGQAGSLDKFFGNNGIVITDFYQRSFDNGLSMTLQPDGKILVSGSANADFALVRYNINGKPDNTFGVKGRVATDIQHSGDVGYDVAVQPDKKILVAGSANILKGFLRENDFALARYNANGTLDSAFGNNGKQTTDIKNSEDIGYATAVQNDGKILVTGSVTKDHNTVFALVRYDQNGFPDESFGKHGRVVTSINGVTDQAHAIAIQKDGKIVVAGFSFSGENFDIALVRYNTNGTTDNSFGSNGIVTTDFGKGDDGGYAMALQPDGKILVTGYTYNGSTFDIALLRYNTNGTSDNRFGIGGKVHTDVSSYHDDGYSVAVQTDGKIVVGGTSYQEPYFSNADFTLVRYNSNGKLDTAFGKGGKVTTSIGSSEDYGQAVAIQADGKIVLAGFSDISPSYDIVVARYIGEECNSLYSKIQNERFFYLHP